MSAPIRDETPLAGTHGNGTAYGSLVADHLTSADLAALNEVLEAAGERAPLLHALLLEVERNLVAQQMVVEAEYFNAVIQSDATAFEILPALFGKADWDSNRILGKRSVPYIRVANISVHCDART